MNRDQAISLLKHYNTQAFHIQHALTVEQVMGWFAQDQGYGDEQAHWEMVGLLHDIDFGSYPDQHCAVAPGILKDAGFDENFIHSVTSHGYGICAGSPKPEHQMEKVLYAVDELTGLIGAAALMRPSKSVQDMELKSLKKKFKDKSFAAGCSRDTISQGAQMLGWTLDELLGKALQAMKDIEAELIRQIQNVCAPASQSGEH